MAAIGAISGPVHWFSIFLGSALLGGVWPFAWWFGPAGWAGRFEQCRADIRGCGSFRLHWERSAEVDVRSGKGAALPHALAIAGATLFYLAATWVKT